ncbi:Alpha-glucosidase [Fulvivirga imtechensis AK7]|uniref:Alpha-glucosidase n=1 Tax=Fulvivirga imtechensis AK7 TaxID=1237149 RepID=L8JRV9_9BACT|nr:glycoside hydrolase family 97 protein [Fulvivirga imtechensis]ELR70209.1 Alpha-glucosidase [Fulvivirga imtechensis AK7]
MACQMPVETEAPLTIASPSGNNTVSFFLSAKGEPGYTITHNQTLVIDTSWIGFDFKDANPLRSGLVVKNSSSKTVTETWEMPWGEQRKVKNNFNELTIDLEEQEGLQRHFSMIFRVYDDGLGFRYHFPKQENMKEVIITDENTQFQLTGDHQVWWIPGDWDIYEHLYNETRFSEIDALSKRDHPNLAQTYIPENAVNTPVTMKTAEGLYLSFHEANLTDYSGMTLKVDPDNLSMRSELVGSEITGYKVKRNTPFSTPWRTIQIADKAGDLIESKLIVNLNEPNKIGDVSWFKPTKYVGIWWEMHLGKSSWDRASDKHGATTENTKKFIDFAAANNIGAVLVEGWNTGWEHWIGFEDREGVFDFVTPYEDYDLQEVVHYGKEKGVEIIMHHETSAAPRTYEQQLDTAYKLMESLGIHAVKTGYVGKIIPKGEYHHGQWMVNHYRKVLEKAAEHQVAVNAHEPIKATGIRRTLPNAIAREGLRGQEFNAWASDGGNPPSHLPTVAFTRMLAGPIDYTPGIFNIKLKPWKENNQVNTTLAHQLALFVVIYSPVQMAADLPEYYEGNKAFQFIRDVGVDWEESKVLNGEVGDYVTIARRERGSDKWFVGSITDENTRQLNIPLDFLDNGKNYKATIYGDERDAHWDKNPTAYRITERTVTSEDSLDLRLAPGGGAAISLIPAE